MKFRLTTLLYLFALLAAALAAFGAAGVWVVGGVLAFWTGLFNLSRQEYKALMVIAAVFWLLILLLMPAVTTTREAADRNHCSNNMKHLLLAIQYYHDTKGQLPPPIATAPDGQPLYSWRFIIFPYLEGSWNFQHVRRDEPWDGPNNSKLKGPMYEFECPTHGIFGDTNYFAVTGPQAAWGDGEPRTLDDVTDGTDQTILLIEAAGRGVNWKEPRDLTFDEAVDLLSSPIRLSGSDGHKAGGGYFIKSRYVRNVAMCDGSVLRLPVPIEREQAIALLTASGGEAVDMTQLDWYSAPQLDFGKIWAFSVFCVLALLPGVPPLRKWIWPRFAAEGEP